MQIAQTKSRGTAGAATTDAAPQDSLAATGDASRMPAYALGQDAPTIPLLGGLVQTKLAVGSAGDPYEGEADAVAAHVTSDNEGAPPPSISTVTAHALAPSAPAGVGGGEAVQKKSPSVPAVEEEQEPVQLAQRQAEDEEAVVGPRSEDEEPVQLKAKPGRRGLDEEEEEKRERERRAEGAINNRQGGSPLDEETRSHVEQRMGQDFSDVRVHDDAQSADANKALKSRAFANRNHIFLGAGESKKDKRLLAHELTHVVQQGGVSRRRPPKGASEAEQPTTEATQPGGTTKPAAAVKQPPLTPPGTPVPAPAGTAPAGTTPTSTTTPPPVTATPPGKAPSAQLPAATAAPGAAQTGLTGVITPATPAGLAAPSGATPSPAAGAEPEAVGAGPKAAGAEVKPAGAEAGAAPEAEAGKAPAEGEAAAAGAKEEGGEKKAEGGAAAPEAAGEAQAAPASEVPAELGGAAGGAMAGGGAAPAAEGGKEAGAGGGASVSAEGGEAEGGGSEEEGAAEMEERMAAASGEKKSEGEGGGAAEAAGEESAAEEPEPEAEKAGDEPEQLAAPEPEQAAATAGGGGGGEPPMPAEQSDTVSEEAAADALSGGGGDIQEAGEAVKEANAAEGAEEEAAGASEGAEVEAAGAGGGGAEAPAEEVAPAETPGAEAAAEGESEAAGAAPEPGSESGELAPAERDAAMSSLAAGGGGEGGGGGGGGGGAAIPDKQEPEAPDVSGSEPSQAMAALSGLSPAKVLQGLSGVNASVTRSVGEERAEAAANPPEMERPSGSPVTKQAPTDVPAAPSEAEGEAAQEVAPEGEAQPVPEPEPLPPAPELPTQAVAAPQVTGDEKGELSEDDVENLQSSISSLPTSDPGLEVDAGEPPPLELEGDADPQRAAEQRANLEQSVAETHAQGQRDAAQPMGESEIYPTVPKETLRANVPAAGGGGGGAAAGGGPAAAAAMAGGEGGGDSAEAASIIAEEKSGGEIQAAVSKAQGDMAAERVKHDEKVAEEKSKSQEEIAKAESENAAAQEAERGKAQGEVQQARADWSEEQQQVVDENQAKADEVTAEGEEEVEVQRVKGETEAATAIEDGNKEADTARADAEQKAESEKQKGEQESGGGFFGWLSSKATSFFNSIKAGIKAAFDAARKLVKAAIEKAKQLAVAAIEAARKAIVDAIRKVGDALIALGDVLLAAFPGLREKWRNYIKEKVAAAEAAVNKLAEDLKAGVQKLLDMLGAAIDAALGLLEKGLLAAVDAANAVVQGAIKAAQAVAEALGAFMVLVKDIASNPGGWIANLGSAAVDGVKNHLWGAFKTAVKQWFSDKVEEVLGLGGMIWGVLTKGGIKMAEIGSMAWEAIKAAIPSVLIGLIIEKVVSMIIPAAGAVLAIIEGLQAAWGTVSRIIKAFGLFMAFLKAVKGGNAGPQFAQAVAAAAIVVIDFVANWLLKRLRKPAGKVAGKVKALAQRILKKLKKAVSKVGKKIKKAMKKVGQKLKKLGAKIKGKFKKLSGKLRKKKGKKPKKGKEKKPDKSKEQKKRERLEKAVKAIQPKLTALLKKAPSKLRLKATLGLWKVYYRLSSLKIDEGGNVTASINPSMQVGRGITITDEELGQMLLPLYQAAVQQAMQEMRADPKEGKQVRAAERSVTQGQGLPAGATRAQQITALHRLPNPKHTGKGQTTGPLPIVPGVEVSTNAKTLVSGQLQAEGRPFFPGAYAGSIDKMNAMSPADRAQAEAVFGILPVWESAREPGAAIPIAMSERMNIADPLHPNIPKEKQFSGEMPGYDKRNKTAVGSVEAVQSPMAAVGAVDITDPRHEIPQASLEFSVGVISRMVMEAARGNAAYKHSGAIPPRLAQAMERFVTATKRRIKNKSRVSEKSMAGLKGELMQQLKLFFKSL